MEIPSGSYRTKSPQSPASVESRSSDIDTVDLCTDQEQFDLEVDAGRINLADIKQKPSTSTARELDNRKNDSSSPSSRTSRKNTPVRGRKRRPRSYNSSRSSSSSSSSSESTSSSSESDRPYYLDKKREKDRVRKLKRYRKSIRHNRHDSRERRRSPERRSNERRDSRRRPNSPSKRQPKIIILPPMMGNPYIHQATQMMPYMPYFQQQMMPPHEFHGPMQMSQMHQMPCMQPGLPMGPFMGPGSSIPPHGGFQPMPPHRTIPNQQSFHWKKWKKQKKQKQQKNSQNQPKQPNQTSQQNQKQ